MSTWSSEDRAAAQEGDPLAALHPLVAAAAAGDAAAHARLAAALQPAALAAASAVFRTARGERREHGEPADAVADAFERLWAPGADGRRGWARFDPRKGRLAPWVARIASHLSAHYARNAHRRAQLLAAFDPAPPRELDAEAALVEAEDHRRRREAVHRGLAALSAADRTLLTLKYLAEVPLKQREIAAALGVSGPAVNSALERARKRLRPMVEAALA